MPTHQPAVLFIRVPAVPAEIDAEWNAWYDRLHIEYRMNKPHFLGARRYRVLSGTPQCFVLYELSSVDALTSPAYLELRQWEGSQPPGSFELIAPNLPGFERGVYEQISGSEWPSEALDTATIFVAGHDPLPDDEDAFNAWYDGEHASAVKRVPGVTALRRFRLTRSPMTSKSGKKTTRPQYVAAYYLSSEAAAESEAFSSAIESTWTKGHSGGAPRFSILGHCIYSTAARQPGDGGR